MTIEQLFGTLQQSVVSTWRKHLRTAKYSKHMALNDFYEEMPEKVDDLIEAWMGVNGKKIKNYENILQSSNMNTLSYLKELRRVVKQGYVLMNGEKELEALLDDIVELIDSTLYKVKELNENNMIDLKDFINESLINESNNDFKSIDILYKEDGDLISISTCFNWLEELGWEKMSEEEYAEAIHDINDDIEEDVFFSRYCECIMAMAKLGRKQTLKYIKKISSKEEMEDFGINE